MPRAKADCKKCQGSGEVYVRMVENEGGDSQDIFAFCDCISAEELAETE